VGNDPVEVAVGGHIDRPDRCPSCGKGMIFRGLPPLTMFCGQYSCSLWLREKQVPARAE